MNAQVVERWENRPELVVVETSNHIGMSFSNTSEARKLFTTVTGVLLQAYPDTVVKYIDSQTPAPTTLSLTDRASLHAEFREIKEECSVDGWDTPSSKSIPNAIFNMAEQLISLFPTYLANPELIPGNDGVLGFEWENDRGYLIVDITLEGVLYYIAKVGDRKNRGSIDYDASEFSTVLTVFLNKLYKSN
jgi:hypothetical protein